MKGSDIPAAMPSAMAANAETCNVAKRVANAIPNHIPHSIKHAHPQCRARRKVRPSRMARISVPSTAQAAIPHIAACVAGINRHARVTNAAASPPGAVHIASSASGITAAVSITMPASIATRHGSHSVRTVSAFIPPPARCRR